MRKRREDKQLRKTQGNARDQTEKMEKRKKSSKCKREGDREEYNSG